MEQINRDALFCDETEDYRCPSEADAGEVVTFYFRTEKNGADAVVLLEYDPETGALLQEWQMKRLSWECCAGSVGNGADTNRGIDGSGMADKSDSRFDYYSCALTLGTKTFSYVFQVTWGENVCLYNRIGLTEDAAAHPFRLIPGFHVPEWSKGALMYQIYVDRFCNGDPTNDTETNEYIYLKKPVTRVTDWKEPISTLDVGRFYGGDLQGVLDKLDYLKSLKIEAIYLNPVFVSPSNHKYDCQDYDHIDPHYGVILEDADGLVCPEDTDNDRAHKYMTRTADEQNLEASDAFFARLIEEAHKRGIRVLVDGVFNHCGSFNKWLDRELIYESADGYEVGAFVSPKSPYRNYFLFHRTGENEWPGNGSYDGWWGHDTLPKLNYEDSKELEEYVLGIAKKWVSPPYNVDGWRLDVAADLGRSNEYNHEFWKKFRKAVKEANPHALILAEHYGDPSDWLQGDEWDSVMNYDAFMEPVTWFLTGMEKHSDEYRGDLLGNADHFMNAMKHHMANMMTPSLQTAMNQLSNHDHSRFLTRTNHKVGRVGQLGSRAAEEGVSLAVMREAIIMQMTWPGAPTLYYGDEAGLCGFTDPDNRRTYPWGREKRDLINFYREMIQIHRKSLALRKGSIKMLKAEPDLLAYGRFWGNEQIVVIINNSDHLKEVRVPVWQAEVAEGHNMARVMYSYEDGYIGEFEEYIVKEGNISLMMGKKSAIVLKNKKW